MAGGEEMDRESIDKSTRHIRSVQRIESEFAGLSDIEINEHLWMLQDEVTARWESCHRSYSALFAALNRGGRFRKAAFDIRLKHEQINGKPVDTYFHIWYDRPADTYNSRPYMDLGGGIYEHSPVLESFGHDYTYRHDTQRSKSAKLTVDNSGHEVEILLQRINGYRVQSETHHTKAVFCAAMQDGILPDLENVEDTLFVLWSAALDDDLNPDIARRLRAMDLD